MIDFSLKKFANLLEEMLNRISNVYDKRDTSPIPTALGPAAYGLEDFYIALDQVQRGAFVRTAVGDDLDQLALVGGISRAPASAAVRLGLFTGSLTASDLISTRYSTLNGADAINFIATNEYTRPIEASVVRSTWEASSLGGSDGTFEFSFVAGWTYNGEPVSLTTYGISVSGPVAAGDVITITRTSTAVTAEVTLSTTVISLEMVAETAGSVGNEYSGTILPISVLSGLTSAVLADILVLGDDLEPDEELRDRLIEALDEDPFAGNIAAYKNHVRDIDGVGAVQVYPCGNVTEDNPDGAGTVVLSVLGADFLPASSFVIEKVQTDVDPEENQGIGLGFAPIGATVTVVAPSSVTVNVSATVSLAPGVTIGQVEPIVSEAIDEYLLGIRKTWDDNTAQAGVAYQADVYLSRISAAIVNTEGIVNATNIKINGSAADLSLTQTGTTQQVPIRGTVTLSE